MFAECRERCFHCVLSVVPSIRGGLYTLAVACQDRPQNNRPKNTTKQLRPANRVSPNWGVWRLWVCICKCVVCCTYIRIFIAHTSHYIWSHKQVQHFECVCARFWMSACVHMDCKCVCWWAVGKFGLWACVGCDGEVKFSEELAVQRSGYEGSSWHLKTPASTWNANSAAHVSVTHHLLHTIMTIFIVFVTYCHF